jgi:hypothetical protein
MVQASKLPPEGCKGGGCVFRIERAGALLSHQCGHPLRPGNQRNVGVVIGLRAGALPDPGGLGFLHVSLDQRAAVEKKAFIG